MFKSIVVAIFLVGAVGAFVFFTNTQKSPDYHLDVSKDSSTPEQVFSLELNVGAQTIDDSVTITRAYLTESGFIVLREVIESKLGQIVEISQYLKAGEHADIKIPVGDFYDGTNELIAVIYKDVGDDEVFNDLDTPIVDAKGSVMARYVKTGEVVPASLLQANTNSQLGHMMGNMKMETVRYTNDGFVPTQLDIQVGTMVQFVNESDTDMWVASNVHPAHDILPTFDQFGTTEKGGVYTYVFDKAGDWKYHDHINAAFEGVISVQ
ncbi:hypothetical protein H6787_02620 [Candidatus Nomurabacteria bacterium]|nr:hypothetical protein [Candidatus Nomurabacteria bacterium]